MNPKEVLACLRAVKRSTPDAVSVGDLLEHLLEENESLKLKIERLHEIVNELRWKGHDL